MNTDLLLDLLAKASYLLAAALFILGLKRMSSPVTARKGIVQAGWAWCWPRPSPSSRRPPGVRTASTRSTSA
ncbi:MAG: NAD(P)(+) transhydrogenase (Re/Si-specific) subunit beta [Chiayiivirga sp.]|jgi:hypothetical protein|nr:NAD(P)(+) transhydrogenase (Re/Si-specific) subunit beta [Chiayiivirga sp.]